MLDFIRDNAQSWVVKIIFALIIFVFMFWGIGGMQRDSAGIVATVGKSNITTREVALAEENAMKMLKARAPGLTDEQLRSFGLRLQVFQRIVTDKLLEQEATKLGLVVTQSELLGEASKNNIFLNEKGQFDPERYKNILAANKISPETYEDSLRKEIVLRRFQEYVQLPAKLDPKSARERFEFASEKRGVRYVLFKTSDFLNQVEISDDEIQKYYDDNKQQAFVTPPKIQLEYLVITPQNLSKNAQISEQEISEYYEKNKETLFSQPERVKARHILALLPADADEATVKQAEGKMRGILKDLKAKKDFATLAKANSQDGSAEQGGDLGWLKRGDTVPPFDEVLFKLKPGEISDLVRTQFGLHIIKAEEYQPAGFISLDDARPEILETLRGERGNNLLLDAQIIASEGLSNALTLQQIADELHLQPEQTELIAQNEAGALLGVDAEGMKQLDLLSPEQPTVDVLLKTHDGFVLPALLKREQERVQSLDEARERIVEILRAQKASELAAKEARVALDEFKGEQVPQAFASRVVENTPLLRDMHPDNINDATSLMEAVFKANNADWLQEVFTVSEGAVIAARGRVVPVDSSEWDKVSEKIINALEDGKRQELFQVYMAELFRLNPVNILNPGFLNGDNRVQSN